ncbi:hypothetical protein FRACYDRAFT_237145 [Fragilariopsis cylindrus CCMP1102]|uniref:Uncharacterized protein n=1 Tax=Fragilariopsis cylindrus CCMP1102 TaxID=635003 RepID=A0A1E7FM27_9STRA|nr:hypothetical protein FRACYDRAFT_237145 [Fragilariopsis cylindrus CCMP1102]|eukprot:OEU18863.1 hypothetical protein FRACYDRAFT_237145 [Fragilariopsis cylindrus CCMP1102]
MTIAYEQENSGAATCHMLPCNIDYEGMAKTHMYFKPILVENGILASTFRGRGLLAATTTTTTTTTTTKTQEEGEEKIEDDENENACAVVAKPHLLSIEENKIFSKASISNVVEWHHEHNPQTIKLFHQEENSRVQLANDWHEIAKALHDPLPIEE